MSSTSCSTPRNALSKQVGGTHYDRAVQPIEIMYMYNTTPAVGKALKYLLRYRDKNGLQDLKKAAHCVALAIELEYGEHNDNNSS